MPRGPVVASPVPGAVPQNPGDVIQSSVWNATVDDIYNIFNTIQPVEYGGNGVADGKPLDNSFGIRNSVDTSKLAIFSATNIPTATTLTYALPATSGTLALTSDTAFDRSSSPVNLSLSATVASNALTIAIKGNDGNDPSASNPVYIPFRSATANSGDVDVLTLTAATSVVVSSGSTLGTTSAVLANLVVVGFNDAGTFRLGIINPTSGIQIIDGIASSTAEGGAGAADSAGVFYTGTAVASKAYTVLGRISITEATAGTWATAPSSVSVGADASTAVARLTASLPTFACRAWVSFSGTTGTIYSSGNVSSITKNATGDYTITFAQAMPDTNYAATASLSASLPTSWTGAVALHASQSAQSAPTTNSMRIAVRDSGNIAIDYPYISVTVFR